MPPARASAGEANITCFPSNSIIPESGVSTPLIIFTSVDLPAPLSPTSPIISPLGIVKDTFSSATTAPKFLLMPCARRTAPDTNFASVIGQRVSLRAELLPYLQSTLGPETRLGRQRRFALRFGPNSLRNFQLTLAVPSQRHRSGLGLNRPAQRAASSPQQFQKLL